MSSLRNLTIPLSAQARAPRVTPGQRRSLRAGGGAPPGRADQDAGQVLAVGLATRGCPSPALVPSAARAAASAIEAPTASADSTAVARSGVEPMLTSATACALDGHADDRQVDRPLVELLERPRGRAGRLGHLDLREQLARLERGLEDALEELRGGHRSRVPPAPRITNVASSASSVAGRSAAASPCATEPPIVPRCRICGSPTASAVCASSGTSDAQQRRRGDVVVPGQRADRHVGALVADVGRARGPGRGRSARSARRTAASSAAAATARRPGTWRPRRARPRARGPRRPTWPGRR